MTEVAADPQTPQDSLRELNRLLESALRMGGDDTKNNSSNSSGNGNSSDAKNEESEEPQGGEWRLDTARRLGGVSTNIHCNSNYLFSCSIFMPDLLTKMHSSSCYQLLPTKLLVNN
jgi:hypothetical protein